MKIREDELGEIRIVESAEDLKRRWIGQRVKRMGFELPSPSLTKDELKDWKAAIIARASDTAKASICAEEDARILEMLDDLAEVSEVMER